MMEVMLHSLLTKIHDMKLNGGSHVGHHQPAQGQDDPRHHEADQHPAQGGEQENTSAVLAILLTDGYFRWSLEVWPTCLEPDQPGESQSALPHRQFSSIPRKPAE